MLFRLQPKQSPPAATKKFQSKTNSSTICIFPAIERGSTVTTEQAPDAILDLLARFERNRETYQANAYNETQLRREFIDPFFAALGWDVDNKQGFAEAYKDVIHEDAIKIGGATKAPDYCFRIGGTRKFFVEAKKPAVNLKDEVSPAFQLRRYAWSAKLPLSILTDFEEFAVYDCRVRPAKNDKPAVGRILFLNYQDYAARWEEISRVFSKQAVLEGAFDKYAETTKAKKGTAEVDAAFLKEIESWREALARNIALRNPKLTQRELNFSVQRTIDRLIFLRICEDRGIEDYGALQALLNGERVYPRLRDLFHRADERYNSGIFHFQKEKDRREEPDELTLRLQIDDKPLKDIIRSLYYPDSPYEFSVLPADILGQVYEQFLGKVIRLTSGHQAKVEDKPEVKKAGGVYYTPTYIVDYIVKNTVGKLLEGKIPKQVAGVGAHGRAPLRILDPACGSGSFLIGAYQYLLDWHRDWYVNDGPEKHAAGKRPELYQAGKGDWRLTTAERKRILLNNIFGVDIDPQAVEVTKLSLLLKVLEGENEQTISQQLKFFHERALPDLSSNIKCGNSLIGPDFYEQQLNLIDDEERLRINAFDWQAEFAEIMNAGGFDAVIGNPPYIRIQTMKEWAPVEVEVYKQSYQAASAGNYDIYVVFVEKGLGLLNKSGRLGFILPHKFFNAKYGEALRALIAKGKHLSHVVHFGDQQIFAGATTYTCLLFLDKAGRDECHFVKIDDVESWRIENKAVEGKIAASSIASAEWNFAVGRGADLFEKFGRMPVKLGDVAQRIFQGFKTGADSVFILEEHSNGKYYSKALESVIHIETKYLRPLYKSGEMKRYYLHKNSRFVIFPYRDGTLIGWREISAKAPKTAEYLRSCKEILAKREKGRWAGEQWYCYSRNQALEVVSNAKILTADLNPSANYCFDELGKACFPGGAAGGYGIILNQSEYLYILGLLNSKAVDYYHKQISTNFRGGWYGYDAKVIRNIPIRTINFSDPADKTRHDRMVALVERMLALHQQLAAAKVGHDKTALQRQIEATDKQIDQLVYELYGLSEEEIKII
ncbi:restriction endonuclease subunit M, partial [candidate division KSB1 bacterium]